MSFRRHYGTASYGSSLVSSPITNSYSSRSLGGYSSPYSTPSYSPSLSSYGGYGSYGKSGARTRSTSLPRDTRERSVSRHSSYSRGSSPPRSRHHDAVDTSSALYDLTNSALNRHHSFSGSKVTTGVLPITTTRSYSRDYGNHYAAAKALARAARSKSIGSSSSINSVSSGYISRSGVSVALVHPPTSHSHIIPARSSSTLEASCTPGTFSFCVREKRCRGAPSYKRSLHLGHGITMVLVCRDTPTCSTSRCWGDCPGLRVGRHTHTHSFISSCRCSTHTHT